MTNDDQPRRGRRSAQEREPAASSQPAPTVARHGRLRRSRPVIGALKAVGIVAAVALVSTVSVAGIAAWSVVHEAQPSVPFTAIGPSGKAQHKTEQITAYSGEVNMLVVASDTRTGQGAGFDDAANQAASSGVGNNDTNLLIHINEDHTSMAVISLPRDLEVPLPACKNDSGGTTPASSLGMLNTSLGRGGVKMGLQCVATTVASLTGVQIDYAAMVKFDGVVKMTTAVGGVTVCLATPLVDPNTDPPLNIPTAGPHVFKGKEAGAFLRTREGVGFGGDTARISNQQVFMSALMRKIVNGGVLSNPVQLYNLSSTALKSVQKSSSLTAPTLVKIGVAVKSIGLDNIVFFQYPSVDDPADANRLIPDPAGVTALKAALVSNQAITLAPGSLGQSAQLATPSASSSATSAPAAPSTPKSSSASKAPAPSKTAAVLPGTATGQSAAQETCTAKKAY